MFDNLKGKFKKASVKATVLAVAIPFSGFGVISDAMAGHNTGFYEQATEICSPRIASPISNGISIEKQVLLDEALFNIRRSPLASSYLQQQGGGVCLSSYDIPVKLDKFGNPELSFANNAYAKGEVIFLLADSLVDNYLSNNGFKDYGRYAGVKNEFRTAVRMAMTAQILTEIERAGDSSGMQAALQTDFAPVFKSFKSHNIIDIQNGKAAIDAIKTYFKITDHNFHSHRANSHDMQAMYEMGNRPNDKNIFQDYFRNGTSFSLRYFTGDNIRDNIYKKNPYHSHHKQ